MTSVHRRSRETFPPTGSTGAVLSSSSRPETAGSNSSTSENRRRETCRRCPAVSPEGGRALASRSSRRSRLASATLGVRSVLLVVKARPVDDVDLLDVLAHRPVLPAVELKIGVAVPRHRSVPRPRLHDAFGADQGGEGAEAFLK